MNFLAAVLLLSCTPAAMLDFAMPIWEADTAIRIEDAYKWTYQAMRGGEHAVPDEESARRWLENEWKNIGERPIDELWQPLCPAGEIGRLNLRPFRSRRGSPDALLKAFLTSSREYRPDAAGFITAWTELGGRLSVRSAGRLTYTAWAKLDRKMKAEGYPAIHHSKAYEARKKPAYRILTIDEMQKLTR